MMSLGGERESAVDLGHSTPDVDVVVLIVSIVSPSEDKGRTLGVVLRLSFTSPSPSSSSP